MTTDCKIVQESPAPRGDESVRVLADVGTDILLGDKRKILTEEVNDESELAKRCGAGVNFEKWHPEPVEGGKCDGIPVERTGRLDIPSDKGILG